MARGLGEVDDWGLLAFLDHGGSTRTQYSTHGAGATCARDSSVMLACVPPSPAPAARQVHHPVEYARVVSRIANEADLTAVELDDLLPAGGGGHGLDAVLHGGARSCMAVLMPTGHLGRHAWACESPLIAAALPRPTPRRAVPQPR